MSKSEMKQAWSDVADELSELGQKLKYHVQEEFSENRSDDVKDALKRLADAIEATVEVVGHASKDQAVRDDVARTGQRLVDALSTTFDQAVSGVKSAMPKDEHD